MVRATHRRQGGQHALLLLLLMGGAALLLSACQSAPPPTCTTTWIGPTGGNFNVAAHWSGNAVPGPSAHACANATADIVITDVRAVGRVAFEGDVTISTTGSLNVGYGPSTIAALHLTGMYTGRAETTVHTLDVDGGALGGDGTLSVPADGSATIDGARLRDKRVLIVAGAADLDGAVTVCGTASMTVAGTAVTTTPLDVRVASCSASGTALTVGAGAQWQVDADVDISVPVTTDGHLALASPATFATAQPIHGGTWSGDGTIVGDIDGDATLQPGGTGATGTLTVQGSVRLDGGAVAVELAGPAIGTQSDLLSVTGSADLTGAAMDVTSIGGYAPAAGTLTDTIQAAAMTGPVATFSEASTSGHLIPSYATSTMALRATVDCDPAQFHPGMHLSSTVLWNLDLRWCDLSGAVLDQVGTAFVDLSHANLRGAAILHGGYNGTTFQGADLTGAVLLEVDEYDSPPGAWTGAICRDGQPVDASCFEDSPPVHIVDTSAADLVDELPGDGLCRTSAGTCSLRAAVMEANTTPDRTTLIGPDDFDLAASVPPSIVDDDDDATGDLDVRAPIELLWVGTTPADGAAIFDVGPGVPMLATVWPGGGSAPVVTTDGGPFIGTAFGQTTARTGPTFDLHGNAAVAVGSTEVGGVLVDHDAGIVSVHDHEWSDEPRTDADLILRDRAVVSDFSMVGGTIVALPGADVTVRNLQLSEGAVGIANAGSMRLEAVDVEGNGVGIVNRGDLTVAQSAVIASTAAAGDPEPTRTFDGMTFSGRGGVVTAVPSATTTIDRSTISGNAGGGVVASTGMTHIVDSTIADNGVAGIVGPSATATNTIVGARDGSPACADHITSADWNLAADASCGLSGAHDLADIDPMLKPLALVVRWDGTWATPTDVHGHPLDSHSPAVDTGRPDCTGPDQPGTGRPLDGDGDGNAVCDRGSIEGRTRQELSFVVDTASLSKDTMEGDGICRTAAGTCSLPAAISEANLAFGTDDITIAPGVTLASGGSLPTVRTDVTIVGNDLGRAPKVTVDSGSSVDAVDISFDGATIAGGASLVVDSATVLQTTTNNGTFELRDGVISNVVNNGTATIERSSAARVTTGTTGTTAIESVVFSDGLVNGGTTTVVRSQIRSTGNAVSMTSPTSTTRLDTVVAVGKVGISGSGAAELIDSTVRGLGTITDQGQAVASTGVVTATNSIFAGGTASPTCTNPIVSEGWNLVADSSCGLTETTDITGATGVTGDFELIPGLRGPWPVLGSPALDGGRPGCGALDVAGRTRLIDGDGDGSAVCDRGAIEANERSDRAFVVDATTSALDIAPGDGVCATATGVCTLRAAAMEAATAPGTITITLPTSTTISGAVEGASDKGPSEGDIDLIGDLSLVGNGSTITGSVQVYGPSEVASTTVGENLLLDGDTALTGVTAKYIGTSGGTTSATAVSATADLWSAGPLALSDSAIAGSVSAYQGGTVQRVSAGRLGHYGGELTVEQSSVRSTGTAITAASPGALVVRATSISGTTTGIAANAGTTSLEHVTISASGKGIVTTGGTVTMHNSVIDTTTSGSACTGPVTSAGWNLVWDGSCALSGTADLEHQPAILSPPNSYGTTGAPAPRTGSPAIDSGPPTCGVTDAIGTARPQDGDGVGGAACDRGAVEARPPTALTLTVTTTVDGVDIAPGDGICQTAVAGQCTLRAAVMESNARNGADTIRQIAFGTSVGTAGDDTGYDDASTGDLDIWGPVTLQGRFGSTQSSIEVLPGAELTTDTFAMSGGLTNAGTTTGTGVTFGTSNYGGIHQVTVTNTGTLTVIDSRISFTTFVNTGALTLRGLRTPRAGDPNVQGTGSVVIERSYLGGSQTLDASTLTIIGSTLDRPLDVGTAPTTITDSTLLGTLSASGTSTTVTNSIVAGCTGSITSGGYNLVRPTSCGFTHPTDLQQQDLGIGRVNDNGGGQGMLSALPVPGSAAVDSGRPGCTGTDQRRKTRVVDGDGVGGAACDRGANELGAIAPRSFTVTTTVDRADASPGDGICQTTVAGECSLRAAVMEANTSNGSDQIALVGGATYSPTATFSNPWAIWDGESSIDEFSIESAIAIAGNGATISSAWAVFEGGSGSSLQLVSTEVSGNGPLITTSGSLLVDRSTLSGGDTAITASGPTTTVRSSTISGATTGLWVSSGTAVVEHSTIVTGSVGVRQSYFAGMQLLNSIVQVGPTGTACLGTASSSGWNLVSDVTCSLTGPNDLAGQSAALGPLTANGGPTRTHLPTIGSPAIDSGAPTCPAVDQRGVARPQGAQCDRGAVEQ